jgi:Zn-dependent metalloprotease
LPPAEDARTFSTDEAAARHYLAQVIARDTRPRMRGLTAPERPTVMPDVRIRSTQQVPSSNDRLITFDQTRYSIPIFGSRMVVQIDEQRRLVNVGGDVAALPQISPVAAISPADALARIATFADVDPKALSGGPPPTLTFFNVDDDNSWHLAYLCVNVQAAPAAFREGIRNGASHGLGRSPRQLRPTLNYLVDAHDGAILFYFSAAPTAVEIPTECLGSGETGASTTFWGLKLPNEFELCDPRRSIKTYDMKGKDMDADPLPTVAVRSATHDWQTSNKAAVSAHVNATKVYDFYKSVLLRDGIDDKGMELISVVNCTYAQDQPPPQWHNAVWYDNKMWYGQDGGPSASLRSFSRFLDIIAHELTHGVTEYTSNLVYKDQSGALNESFSDIFGVIIANWDPTNPNRDAGTWTWTIGAGLGPGGKPLRDVSDPTVTGDPDHMNDFLNTQDDEGGVHTNSNIHNKGAYNVLTAVDGGGRRVFQPMEAAELYYLCLTRLSNIATFSDVLQELVDVATTYYAGNAVKRADRIKHIRDAYANVGIT